MSAALTYTTRARATTVELEILPQLSRSRVGSSDVKRCEQ